MTRPVYRLLLASLVVLTVVALPFSVIAVADVGDHPTKCYGCHSPMQSGSKESTVGPHNVTNAAEAWNLCTQCHASGGALYQSYPNAPLAGDYVPKSVHASIGCKCHAVLHVGNTSPLGAWLYYYVPAVTTPTTVPAPTSLQRKVLYFEEGVNLTKLGIGTTINNSYTGGPTGVYMVFAANGVVVDPASRYLICFNCHFITTTPTLVGTYKVEGGVLKIGIPPEALKLEPHSITKEAVESILSKYYGAAGPAVPKTAALAGLGALLALGLVVFLHVRRITL